MKGIEIPIEPGIYDYLRKYALSRGFHVWSSETREVLFRIAVEDCHYGMILEDQGIPTQLTHQELADLVEYLQDERAKSLDVGERFIYNPEYTPRIKVPEIEFEADFLPALEESGSYYYVDFSHEGVFYWIRRIVDKRGQLMSRDEAVRLLRSISAKVLFNNYRVTYRQGELTKIWQNLRTQKEGYDLLGTQMKRHIPSADWRVWRNAHIETISDFDAADFKPIGGEPPFDVEAPFWLVAYHPADYISQCYLAHRDDIEPEIENILKDDPQAICALYVCEHEIRGIDRHSAIPGRLEYMGHFSYDVQDFPRIRKSVIFGKLVAIAEVDTHGAGCFYHFVLIGPDVKTDEISISEIHELVKAEGRVIGTLRHEITIFTPYTKEKSPGT